jgi:predicted nucleotidyltransferase component of viral defense system
MDVREICAEKIRAMSERARYRDFYDLFLLIEKYALDLDEIVSYIARKEVRTPISKANIFRNWRVIGTQLEAEMSQIYYSREIDDLRIEKMINDLPLSEISRSA